MKKYLLIAASALCLMACNKEQQDGFRSPDQNVQRASLMVEISGNAAHTKAAQTADEAAVNSLQVFVFNEDQIDVYGSVNDAKSITLDATTGARSVWAVVNAPDLKAVKTLTELKAAVSKFTDNSPDSFVMVGHKDETLSPQSSVTVNVDRIASRVVVGKITRKFSVAGLASLPEEKFEFVRAYLADVTGEQKYDGSMNTYSSWISSALGDGSILKTSPMVYDAPAAAQKIAQNASFEYGRSLYCYPNATTEDSASAHVTRLVVECRIDGAFYTYPVLLSMGVQSNKSYEIRELILTRLGNPSNGDDRIDDGEDEPIVSVEIPFGVEVNDWDVVLVGDSGTVTI